MGASKVSIESANALTKTVAAIQKAKQGSATVRILHLGDSHVAGDYITGTIREGLHADFGDAGRGFIAIDQPTQYGGRAKSFSGWTKDRIVDTGREGRPYGFSGESLESDKKGAKATWTIMSNESRLGVYYQAKPEGNVVKIFVDGKQIGELDTKAESPVSLAKTFDVPVDAKAKGKKPKARELKMVAEGSGVRLFGLSFENGTPGVFYDTIGPVGADAKVYLQLEEQSLVEHLKILDPTLVVLMVGGNDALKIRKGWTDMDKVRRDHEQLLDLLKRTLPKAECLVWSPMDAGDKEGKTIKSKAFLKEIRDMQQQVAKAKGCAFWDLYTSMGGEGSIAKWVDAKVMNADLVHPREKAADLLGRLFLESFLDTVGP